MQELLQMLAVLVAVRDCGVTSKVYLSVTSDGKGMVSADPPHYVLDGKIIPLFSFRNEEELREMLLQEIGETVFKEKVKELGLDKE